MRETYSLLTVYFICIHVLHFINCSGDVLTYYLLEKDPKRCKITSIHQLFEDGETANFVKLFSFSFARKAQSHSHSRIDVCRIQFVHIFPVDNKPLMDKIYFHYIYLPAYLKLMNVGTTGRSKVHDNNLIDYYAKLVLRLK